MSVGALVNSDGKTLSMCLPGSFLDEAIEIMVKGGKNAIAVVQANGKLAGILTDHDVIRAVYARQVGGNSIDSEHVVDWMTGKVITCTPETKLTAALNLMGKHQIRHLVVVEEEMPIAIVSIRDVLRKLHEMDELEVSVLRDLAMAARASIPA